MPVYLNETDVPAKVADCKSCLIVPCRFRPAATLAVKNKTSYIALLRGSLKTASYERFIATMKRSLESIGIRTGVFKSRWRHQFVLCM